MSVLFFRTETTSIPRFKKEPDDKSQPHVMMLSALLVDGERVERGMMSALIRPDQWVSTAGAAATHGLNERVCEMYGIRAHAALALFIDMVRSTKEIVAFNLQFHSFMIAVELARIGATPDAWTRPGLKRTCTMTKSSAIAAAGKPINLVAAHQAMVEQPYVPRLDLYDDLRAVARIHFATIDRGL